MFFFQFLVVKFSIYLNRLVSDSHTKKGKCKMNRFAIITVKGPSLFIGVHYALKSVFKMTVKLRCFTGEHRVLIIQAC